jgi:MEDS: MEthanogen/methylotroph, DcmR Sensory domain
MARKDWYYMHLPKLSIKRLYQFLQTPRAKSTGMTNKSELLRHVINKFLDEQETFYNNTEYVGDFISEMKERDHMTLTFNNEIQFKEIVNAFIKRGINYNQINILIYKKEEQKYLRTLDKIPNINSLFSSQEITIIPADTGFHNDSFFVKPIIKNLLSIMSLAKQRSKRGLNVLGTLPGKLIEQGRYNDAVGLEHTFDEAIKTFEIPVTILCLYNSIPADLEDRLSEYHDIIVKRTSTGLGN